MSEREALALVRRLLAEALDQEAKPTTYVRDLAGRVEGLRSTMRAAITVIDQVGGES
ncbi:hypothetical protein [Streptomyces sp. NBC_00986]|uniref:hypothetical protein n=1 Tax=Streptomyces sp. NBC_00986 TaxID=2903702 RepID=UPI00386AB915|nr:hypothetical protein OG504_39405 [Streptomyces sp. NBC_00986]